MNKESYSSELLSRSVLKTANAEIVARELTVPKVMPDVALLRAMEKRRGEAFGKEVDVANARDEI